MLRTSVLILVLATFSSICFAERKPAPTAEEKAHTAKIAQAEAKGILSLELKNIASDFAIDPATGVVATVSPTHAVVRIYPSLTSAKDIAGSITVKVGNAPCGIGFCTLSGKGTFIVLCAKSRSLCLIDSASREVTTIALKGELPVQLAVASGARLAYYLCDDHNLGRVNLDTRKDEGFAEIDRGTNGDAQSFFDIAVSDDGTVLFNSILPQITCWKITAPASGPWRISSDVTLEAANNKFAADPWGICAMSGNVLCDFTQLTKHTIGTPDIVGFLSNKPAFICYDDEKKDFQAYSYNTRKPLGKVHIPGWEAREMQLADGTTENVGHPNVSEIDVDWASIGGDHHIPPMRLLIDEKNGNALICQREAVAVIPLASFKLPDEPLLLATVEGPTSARVGETVSMKITPRDPKTKVDLASSSPAIKLDGNTLSWTPSAVGRQSTTLVLSGGGAERRIPISLNVRGKCAELPFVPTMWSLADNGKSLFALYAGRVESGNGQEKPAPARIAIVDLQTNAITLDKTFTVALNTAVMDDQNIYASTMATDNILVFSRKDGSEVRRIFVKKGHVENLSILEGGVLYAVTSGNRTQDNAQRYQLPDLKPIDLPVDDSTRRNFGNDVQPIKLAEGWYDNHVLWDASFTKPRLVMNLDNFIRVATRESAWPKDNVETALAPWSARWMGDQLMRDTHGLGSFESKSYCVLAGAPCAVTLIVPANGDREPPRGGLEWRKRQVIVRDLITAKTIKTITLLDEPAAHGEMDVDNEEENQRSLFQAESNLIKESNGIVVVQCGRRFFTLTLKELGADSLPIPIHMSHDQSTFTADIAKPTMLDFSATGGKGPITYALTADAPWLTLDKSTGKVTITPDKLLEKALDNAVLYCVERTPVPRTDPRDAMWKGVCERYRQAIGPMYKRITGSAPTGIPIQITVGVEATDSEQMSIMQEVSVLMILPEETLIPRLVEFDLKSHPEQPDREKLRAQALVRNPATAPSGDVPTTSTADLARKIKEMEEENARLESQMKTLIDARRRTIQATTRP